jgi:hypoxanthine phosphoribosyltransferase
VLAVTLKGAFIFAADLVRHLPENVQIVFVRAASYGNGTTSSGVPRIELPPDFDWKARDVLLVEDIVDTGRTVQALVDAIRSHGAWSVRVCTFLDKPSRREIKVDVEFVGFSLPDDKFVVGYGLDHDEHFRQLPFVGTLKQPPKL